MWCVLSNELPSEIQLASRLETWISYISQREGPVAQILLLRTTDATEGTVSYKLARAGNREVRTCRNCGRILP